MTAVIYYDPEGYTTSGPRLMGRNAAGESFLRGFMLHSQVEEFWVQVEHPDHAQHFAQTLNVTTPDKSVRWVDKNNLGALAQLGVVYYPGPGIGKEAFKRAAYGHDAWSLCAITHTTSSAIAMDALLELLTAPVQPWDAVICTSTTVKHNVERLLQAQVDYLVDRFGIQKFTLPLLPVIPLGIHTQDFVFKVRQKNDARKAIGAGKNTLVVLYMGRLSFHGKAHPLAMYQALEKAAGQLAIGKKIVLVECGWHDNDFIEKAYQEAAQLACPSIRVVALDGRVAQNRTTAWASADIFCSLSDNLQETFGIAPIEAMAAGLPVVVSDWDGYKDTVREGVDGFRVPTLMPAVGLGSDLALRHGLGQDTYDMYLGHTCSFIAVDVEAAAQAFSKLLASSALRKEMGAAGQARAREVYDWSVIIPQYEVLWAQQAEMRKEQGPSLKPLAHPWPARMDPFAAFVSYPSAFLTLETQLDLVDAEGVVAYKRLSEYRQLAMVNFANQVLPTEDECQVVLDELSKGIMSAADIIKVIPADRQAFVFRALAWLLKLGVIKVV